MPDSTSIVPDATQPHLAKDLIEFFVLNVLKSDLSTNFIDGIPNNNADLDATKIHLLPYYLEDKPANCGVVRVSDMEPDGYSPIRQARVSVIFRQPTLSSVSAQKRASQAAEALLQWMRPEGVIRTYSTLPSGRVVLKWDKAMTRPEGEDDAKRFMAAIDFEIMYRDINVP